MKYKCAECKKEVGQVYADRIDKRQRCEKCYYKAPIETELQNTSKKK